MRSSFLVALALAACSKPAPPEQSNVATPAEAPVGKPAPAPQAPKAFAYEEKTDLIYFEYGWSAEAAAIPQLVERFTKDMAKTKAELLVGAKAEKAWREKEKLEFHPFEFSTGYETDGQSARLLSLEVQSGSYTGGAHPNHGINSLLWDRKTAREIKSADLFAEAANRDRLLTQPWCDALNKQRAEKRGEPVGGSDLFDECPGLDQIAFLPTDKDQNGRFERLMLIASPYVAGPYAEGYYEIELPVTRDMIATLKSEYRDSFEPAQPQ